MRELFISATGWACPYYVYSTDMKEGAHHFVVPHQRMLELYEAPARLISGPAVPTFRERTARVVPATAAHHPDLRQREETLPDGSGHHGEVPQLQGHDVEMPGLGVNFSLPRTATERQEQFA